MSVISKVGYFSITTGAVSSTQQISGLGFQPKFIVFFWNGQTALGTDTIDTTLDSKKGVGFATSSGSRIVSGLMQDAASPRVVATGERNDACVGLILHDASDWEGYVSLQSMDVDGFTLLVGKQFTTGYTVMYFAVGGTGITNAAVGTYDYNSTRNQSVTGVGFAPDCVLFLCGGGSIVTENTIITSTSALAFGVAAGIGTISASQPTNTNFWKGKQSSGCIVMNSDGSRNVLSFDRFCLAQPSGVADAMLRSFDSDGFTLVYTTQGGSAYKTCYLAIQGGKHTCELTAIPNISVSQTNSIFGVGQTLGGMFINAGNYTIGTNGGSFQIGAFSAGNPNIALGQGEDNTEPTQARLGMAFSDVIFDQDNTGFQIKTSIQKIVGTNVTLVNDQGQTGSSEFWGIWTISDPIPTVWVDDAENSHWLGGDEY